MYYVFVTNKGWIMDFSMTGNQLLYTMNPEHAAGFEVESLIWTTAEEFNIPRDAISIFESSMF
jgi:hypothetical protein